METDVIRVLSKLKTSQLKKLSHEFHIKQSTTDRDTMINNFVKQNVPHGTKNNFVSRETMNQMGWGLGDEDDKDHGDKDDNDTGDKNLDEISRNPYLLGELVKTLSLADIKKLEATNKAFKDRLTQPAFKSMIKEKTHEAVIKWLKRFPDYRDHTPEQLLNLTNLHLANNPLTKIPSELGEITKAVTYVDLNNNNLTEIPEFLYKIKSLNNLDLSSNQIAKLPSAIERFKKLVRLNLSSNSLKKLPREIGNLTNLQILNLDNNHLTRLPIEIGKLSQLQELDVQMNRLSSIPEAIGLLPYLKFLSLSENELTDLPDTIKNRKELNIDDNDLTDQFITRGYEEE